MPTKRGAKRNTPSEAAEEVDVRETKRHRVTRACDQCRAGRGKCDGASPCQTCTSQGRDCSYDSRTKKRGVQPRYIRALELSLAWLSASTPGVQSKLLSSLTQSDGDLRKALSDVEAGAGELELQDAFRTSRVHRAIERVLAGEDVDADEALHTQMEDTEPERIKSTVHRSNGHWAPPEPQEANPSTSVNGISSTNGASGQPIRLPENAWKMLEYYFAFTHTWLPIIEKQTVLKLMYTYPLESLNRAKAGSGQHAELWSIMALVASQLSHDDQTRDQARSIRMQAEDLLPSPGGVTNYQEFHIRAMTILSLLEVSEGRFLAGWLRIGTVASLLLLFPMLREIGAMTKQCIHMNFAAFIVEQALASHLRVPTHARAGFIETLGEADESSLDEWAPWSDPLASSESDRDQARQPARAVSTLNSLVRIAVRSAHLYESVNSEGMDEISLVVFSLLKNATPEGDRLQPSLLVKGGEGDRLQP